ncbi:MAG: hypothetical protein VYE28_09605, partial [Planctomycetota bacterium]|nr:hypothetical protein [Planctomycetota bacterium]
LGQEKIIVGRSVPAAMIEGCAADVQYTRLPKISSLHPEETSDIQGVVKVMNSDHRLVQMTSATPRCSRIKINFSCAR